MDDGEPVLVFSDLGGRYTRERVTVEVMIYKLEDGEWVLEVEDPEGGSTVWDEKFPTDETALAEFRDTLAKEGIRYFVVEDQARPS